MHAYDLWLTESRKGLKLWLFLFPKFPHVLLLCLKPDAKKQDIKKRGDRGWTALFNHANTSNPSLEYNVGKGKKLPLPMKPQSSAVQKKRAGIPREGTITLQETWAYLLWSIIWMGEIDIIFLNNAALFITHHSQWVVFSMTVPKVKWPMLFSKTVWCKPTGWENAKIYISLNCDAIFSLLIEKM